MMMALLPRAIACALLLAALALPSLAFAAGGGVRYSYESISLNGTNAYVLVPRPERKLRGAPSIAKLNQAFSILKKAKFQSVYGNATMRVSGSTPARAKVTVKLDPRYANFHIITVAEVTYTLTELGVANVSFPGFAKKPITRADVAVPVFSLRVPMTTALGFAQVSPAQIQLPGGKLMQAKDFYAAWKRKDPALIRSLFSYLKSPDIYTVTYLLSLLPKLKIDYAAPTLPLLKHPNASARKGALEALDPLRDRPEVAKALSGFMNKEKDAKLARQAATILGKSKDKKIAVEEQLFVLKRGKAAEAQGAAGKLTGFRNDPRVGKALVAALADKRAGVPRAAADALAKLDDDASQIKALANTKIGAGLRLVVARDLSADKDKASAIAGYSYLGRAAARREAERAIYALAALKTPEARQATEAFLTDSRAPRRHAAASALTTLKSPESLPPIARAMKKNSNDDRLEQAGYTIMMSQPVRTITEQTKARDANIKRLAFRALGVIATKKTSRRLFDTIKTGVGARDARIRGAAARALGAFASNKEAIAMLKKLAKDKSAEVRRDVARAAAKLGGGELAEELTAMLGDTSDDVQAAAIDAMRERRDAAAWDTITQKQGAKSPQIRAAALAYKAALVNRDNKKDVSDIISTLSGAVGGDKASTVKVAALQGLGSFNDENAVTGIAIALNDDVEQVKVAAVSALASTKHPASHDLVANLLDDDKAEVRLAAAQALGSLKASGHKDALKTRLKAEKNVEVKKVIEATLKKL